jgi:hypothetical protein
VRRVDADLARPATLTRGTWRATYSFPANVGPNAAGVESISLSVARSLTRGMDPASAGKGELPLPGMCATKNPTVSDGVFAT